MNDFNAHPEVPPNAATQPLQDAKDTMKSAGESLTKASSVFTDINQHWMSRAKSEMQEFTSLAQSVNGKSPTDAAAIWQQWFSGRMQRASDDTKKLLQDSQRLMSSMMPKS